MRQVGSPPPAASPTSSSQPRRKNRIVLVRCALIAGAVSTFLLLLWISATVANDRAGELSFFSRGSKILDFEEDREEREDVAAAAESGEGGGGGGGEVAGGDGGSEPAQRTCATVEEMGEGFAAGFEKESLRARELIRRHFEVNGAVRVRELPPDQFCHQGFVIGKASEAGFGNEMYKILTAAALSVILNRSLIIGQNRGLYPFGDYISYSNVTFTLTEVKNLWRKKDCFRKYGRNLITRIDNFEDSARTNVLCSDWRHWKQPIIWLQGTPDAVAIQFFLKNIHNELKTAASELLGHPESLQSRPNVFGELMRVIISPTPAIQEAVNWVLNGTDPDVALHMRMMSNRSIRAMQAAVSCVKKALGSYQMVVKPRVALVSDTPSFIKEITPNLRGSSEVINFNYESFVGEFSTGNMKEEHQSLGFRRKDWGPAPRWVAFVDFFLASRAKVAVISGAHRRVGTTYAQLVAALAAAKRHGEGPTPSNFSFLSSFQSNLLVNGLGRQIGWGHAWNRFAGRLSCRHQPHQCALTPLLPSAWWDGQWQSPIYRDIRRLREYGVKLSVDGKVDERALRSYCRARKEHVKTMGLVGL